MEAPAFTIEDHSLVSDIPHKYRNVPTLAQQAFNVYPQRGALASRFGLRLLDTVDGVIIGMNCFESAEGIYYVVVLTTTTLYWMYSQDDFTTIHDMQGSNTLLTAPDNHGGQFGNFIISNGANGTEMKGGVIAVNNADPPIAWRIDDPQWTLGISSQFTDPNCPQTARTVAACTFGVNGNRMMYGNIIDQQDQIRYASRIRWSDLDLPFHFHALAYADLLVTGDNIVAMRSMQNMVVIYKDFSVWLAQPQAGDDAAAFVFQCVDTSKPGPIGCKAVCTGPDGTHIYLGRDANLYSFNGVYVRLLYRLADFDGMYFDPASVDNNFLLFDYYENNIKIFPVLKTVASQMLPIPGAPGGGNVLVPVTYNP